MPRVLHESELRGADLVWLLELEVLGQVFRLSTDHVEVFTDDGESLPYDGGLMPLEVEERFEPYAQSPEEITAQLEVLLPVDAAARVAAGRRWRTGRGSLAVWVRGTTYENRQRLIHRGLVVGAEWGAAGELSRLTLTSRPWEDRAVWPPASQVVDETTWPDAADRAEGLTYPQVFGRPGVYIDTDGTTKYAKGSPALYVDTNTLLVAGHYVRAATVYIVDADGVAEQFDVDQMEDGLGQVVSVVDVSGALSITVDPDTDYWVQWRGGGAMPGKGADAVCDGAGEVLEWWLERSTLPIDYGRLASARERLQHLKLGGYIDEPVTPWEVVQSLLGYLPASVRSGPDGVFVEAWQLDVPAVDVVAHLEDGPGWSRRGAPQDDDEEFTTTVSVNFALDGDSNMKRRARVSYKAWDAAHKWRSPSPYGRNSNEPDTTLDVEAAWVWDYGTAYAIATALMRGRARPGVPYEFEAGVEHAWLRPGHRVAVTSDDLSLSGQPLRVLSKAWSPPMLLFRLHDPGDPFAQ